jgi:hypothetical protein
MKNKYVIFCWFNNNEFEYCVFKRIGNFRDYNLGSLLISGSSKLEKEAHKTIFKEINKLKQSGII